MQAGGQCDSAAPIRSIRPIRNTRVVGLRFANDGRTHSRLSSRIWGRSHPRSTALTELMVILDISPRNCKWSTPEEQRRNQRPRKKKYRPRKLSNVSDLGLNGDLGELEGLF